MLGELIACIGETGRLVDDLNCVAFVEGVLTLRGWYV